MQRVLVAGATGFLSGSVAREFKDRGYFVRALVHLFNRHQGELLAFFTTMATTDVVAPSTGTHTLEAHYRAFGDEK